MALSIEQNAGAIAPTPEEVSLAHSSCQILAAYIHSENPLTINISIDGKDANAITIPAAAYSLLLEILSQMAQGNAVKIIPIKPELTTQEAASILNVSRHDLVGLLEGGEIPYRQVGIRRRILTQDVIDYKNHLDAARRQALEELTAQAQELKMGY